MTLDTALFLDTLAGFARTLAEGCEVSDVLCDLTSRVTTVLAVAGASVSLMEQERLRLVTADSDLVTDLGRTQERDQVGPCAEATRTGEIVALSDLSEMSGRWPNYVTHAQALGIVAAAGIPLRHADVRGSLSLYDSSRRTWSSDDLTVARVFADIAVSYVMSASTLDEHRRTNGQLQRALESRIIIEQAKGIIANHRRTTVDKAFQLLRKHANDHNANLHATADAVVNLSLRP